MAATTLIPVNDAALKAARPDWPLSGWATRWNIRQGRLGCVRLGRRVFVTPELLESFIATHVTIGAQPVDPKRSEVAKRAAATRRSKTVQPLNQPRVVHAAGIEASFALQYERDARKAKP